MARQVIVAGPPGAGKSSRVRRVLSELGDDAIAAEWTRIWAALRMIERDPQGRYPVRRPSPVDSLITSVKKHAVNEASRRGLGLVVSTGSKLELAALRAVLPDAAVEMVEVPEQEALANLRRNYGNEAECPKAVQRWFRTEPDEGFDPYLYWHGRRRA